MQQWDDFLMKFGKVGYPSKKQDSAIDLKDLDFNTAISKDARKIHELMCLAAVMIFPTFAFFDRFTIPQESYWFLTSIRLLITSLIACWLWLQKKKGYHEIYLTYFAFISISWFCCYACVLGGENYLYQHNIAYCTVFLAASMFLLWHWKHSLFVVISSIIAYFYFLEFNSAISYESFFFKGGSVLLTVMILHPLIIVFRYNGFKREFALKMALEQSNEQLKAKNEAMEERNGELLQAREKLNDANKELQNINLNLKNLVDSKTLSLRETHTDLKEAESELDLFLYASYHDLKGPIARLKGLANLALLDVEDERAKEYNRRFLETVNDMEFLMEKLNSVNAIYNHKVINEEVILERYLHEVLNKFNALKALANVEIKIVEADMILADKNLLQPVLQNLIENALRFRTEIREHRLVISCIKENDKTVLSIWDNGCGIPETVIPNIFNMFYRGNIHSKGHGLGLYLVKKAVEKLNGSISVESKEGHFTEFKIIFEPTL